MDFLPYKVKWCRENGLRMYILDNYSTDGSWEYLLENKIPCERVNTMEMFDLGRLQSATDKALRRLNPDWVVYVGLDTFILTQDTLRAEISKCSGNMIGGKWINMHNTGEIRGNPFKTYFYYAPIKSRITLIYKYHPHTRLFGDDLNYGKGKKAVALNGIYVNFGNVKPTKQRDDTYIRRKKAWQHGISKGWGTHYPVYKALGWKWNPNKLRDIRKSEYYELYKQLWTL